MAGAGKRYFTWKDGPFTNRLQLAPGATVYPVFARSHLEGSQAFRGHYTAQFAPTEERDTRLAMLQERRMLVGVFEGPEASPTGVQRVAYCEY